MVLCTFISLLIKSNMCIITFVLSVKLELGCLEIYEPQIGEVTFKFYSESYEQLASQLVTYLKLAPSPNGFIKTLCSSRIIRYADKSMLKELYNAYKNSKLDVYIRMRWLVTRESDKYYCHSCADDPLSGQVQFTLLEAMLRYSINFTDNTNVIKHILGLINKERNVHSAICVKERYRCCFTYALLATNNLRIFTWILLVSNDNIICSSSFMRFLFMKLNIAFNLALSFETQV
jgi:hypothetical protein